MLAGDSLMSRKAGREIYLSRLRRCPPLVRRWRKTNMGADAISNYTEAEALHAEITRLIAVEKTLDEEFWALPEGSAAAASTARAASQIGDQIRRLEVQLWEAGCQQPHNQTAKSGPD